MKKLTSLILIFCLVLSTAITASASSTDSKALESAINAVKRVITIPDDYTNFSQYTYDQEIDGVKTAIWQLNWDHPQGKGSISVSVDANNNITNYYRYTYRDTPSPQISDLTLAEGKKIASAFLDKVCPEYAGQMKEITDTPESPIMPLETSVVSSDKASASVQVYPSDSFYYTFRLYKNGLPVNFIKANVTVDKNTKEVISFYRESQYGNSFTYKDASGLIDKDEAIASYIKNIGLNVEYFSYYNDKAQKMEIFPAYVLNTTSGKYIDAKTGEPINLYMQSSYWGAYDRGSGGAKLESTTNVVAEDVALTKEEQIAVDVMSTLMSKTEAEKIARKLPGITSDMKVTYANLNSNYSDKTKYTWYLSFNDASVSLDAKTGEIVGYNIYGDYGKGRQNLTVDAAKEKAEAFAKNLNADKFAQTEYEFNSTYFKSLLSDDGAVKLTAIPQPADLTSYYFNYVRSVDGTLFRNNSVTVGIDKTTGDIVSYYLNWNDNVNFPKIDKVMSEEEAFSAFNKYFDFSVSYELTEKSIASPVYSFAGGDGVMIHPNTGVKLTWNGQPYQTNTTAYKDIKGHWAENIILTLAENGYYLNSGDENFNPDKNVTQLDFLMYFYGNYMASDADSFYDMLIRNGVITEKEKAPQATVTRQDAAKYISRMLGYEKIAEKNNIFVYQFKDNVAASYKGYVTIASALQIMSGDSKGNFNPSKAVSNAQAAAIVYNYLKVK